MLNQLLRAGTVLALLCLAGCDWWWSPVTRPQPEFKPPPPTTPKDQAPICGKPAEVDAIAIVGLQTQLMQIALSCSGQEDYNRFVTTFRPQLFEARQDLKSFFARAYGRPHAQTALDHYVTELSSAESQYNLLSGAEFCRLAKPSLDAAKTLPPDAKLLAFTAQVPVQQSLDVKPCGTPGAPPLGAQTRATKPRAKSRNPSH